MLVPLKKMYLMFTKMKMLIHLYCIDWETGGVEIIAFDCYSEDY